MNFNNHCNEALYTKAAEVISNIESDQKWKEYLLLETVDLLERGRMFRTSSGGETAPYRVSDVKMLVDAAELKLLWSK
tara:strand:+ start:1142 stop:1375 length:234 start_codon:yes stop_codon:yes gene_type:complete